MISGPGLGLKFNLGPWLFPINEEGLSQRNGESVSLQGGELRKWVHIVEADRLPPMTCRGQLHFTC